MQLSIFQWLRTRTRDAILGGVQDALAALQAAAPEPPEAPRLVLPWDEPESAVTVPEERPQRGGRAK